MLSLGERESLPLNHLLHEQWGHVELLVPEGNAKGIQALGLRLQEDRGYFSSCQWQADNVVISLIRVGPQQSKSRSVQGLKFSVSKLAWVPDSQECTGVWACL